MLRYGSCLPLGTDVFKILWLSESRSAEMSSPSPWLPQCPPSYVDNSFSAPCGQHGKNLNDKVRDEFSHEIIALLTPCVDKRRIKNDNCNISLACDDVKLMNYLLVVAPKSVQTFHHHRTATCQLIHHHV